jgi:hypothetical protein
LKPRFTLGIIKPLSGNLRSFQPVFRQKLPFGQAPFVLAKDKARA